MAGEEQNPVIWNSFIEKVTVLFLISYDRQITTEMILRHCVFYSSNQEESTHHLNLLHGFAVCFENNVKVDFFFFLQG